MSVEEMRRSLRAEGRSARRAVTGEARRRAESQLAGHLLALADLAATPGSTVGAYLADDGEPDLATTIDRLRSAGHDIALPVPTRNGDSLAMLFRRFEPGDPLEVGQLGIPQPPATNPTVVPGLVLVPLVRFDPAGNRLGRGAGYYDRWLAAHPVPTVGVALECQRANALPAAPHDVPLGIVATEMGVRYCSSAPPGSMVSFGQISQDCRLVAPATGKDGGQCE